MTDTNQQAQQSLTLTPEYTTPYNALIRDDVVMGVPRYFLERWVPVLGTDPAALVNTLRQLDYRCEGDVIEISGSALAREAAMSRRHLYKCLDTPWLNAFIRYDSGERIHDKTGKITQQPNRYRVRMDDPLTPADADHLITVLTNLADTPLEAAQKALESDPRDLWAVDPCASSENFTQPRPLTARDVFNRAFPTWTPTNQEDKQMLARCIEDLHRHVTLVRKDGRISKIIVPQYFRRRWWKRLGHDLAWSYLWLRGCVYDNPEAGIQRDVCWIPSLNTLLAIIGRPREWWRRNVEHAKPAPDGWAITDFFKQLDTQKGRDTAHPQWVARQFLVALDIPIAPEDRSRYAELLQHWQPNGGSATNKHTGEPKGPPQINTPEKQGSATIAHRGLPHLCTENQSP